MNLLCYNPYIQIVIFEVSHLVVLWMDTHIYEEGTVCIGSEDEDCVFLRSVDFQLKVYMKSYPEQLNAKKT
jgi:hypothetical protein